MIDERRRLDELLSLEADQRLDEAGHAELERLCARPAHARTREVERGIRAAWETERAEDPDPELAERVLAHLDEEPARPAPRLSFPAPLRRAAAAILAIALLGSIGYEVGQRIHAGATPEGDRLAGWSARWWEVQAPAWRAMGLSEDTVQRIAHVDLEHERQREELGASAPRDRRELLEREHKRALLRVLRTAPEADYRAYLEHVGQTAAQLEAEIGR